MKVRRERVKVFKPDWLVINSDALNYIPKNVQGLDQLNNTIKRSSQLRTLLKRVVVNWT